MHACTQQRLIINETQWTEKRHKNIWGWKQTESFIWIHNDNWKLRLDTVLQIQWQHLQLQLETHLQKAALHVYYDNCKSRLDIDTVSLEGTFCDIVQVPSGAADMQLI